MLARGIQAMHAHITTGPPLVTSTCCDTASCFLHVIPLRYMAVQHRRWWWSRPATMEQCWRGHSSSGQGQTDQTLSWAECWQHYWLVEWTTETTRCVWCWSWGTWSMGRCVRHTPLERHQWSWQSRQPPCRQAVPCWWGRRLAAAAGGSWGQQLLVALGVSSYVCQHLVSITASPSSLALTLHWIEQEHKNTNALPQHFGHLRLWLLPLTILTTLNQG